MSEQNTTSAQTTQTTESAVERYVAILTSAPYNKEAESARAEALAFTGSQLKSVLENLEAFKGFADKKILQADTARIAAQAAASANNTRWYNGTKAKVGYGAAASLVAVAAAGYGFKRVTGVNPLEALRSAAAEAKAGAAAAADAALDAAQANA